MANIQSMNGNLVHRIFPEHDSLVAHFRHWIFMAKTTMSLSFGAAMCKAKKLTN